MKSKILTIMKMNGRQAFAGVVLGWMCCGAASVASAQIPTDMTPGLQRVVNFAKGGMSDDFILNYITNSGTTFSLSDDDIIYLHKQGVSDSVIKSLMLTSAPASPIPQPVVAPPAAAPSPAPSAAAAGPVPPPLDASTSPAQVSPAPSAPPLPAPVAAPPPVFSSQVPLQDNFFADGGLNPSQWLMQSGTLAALAAVNGRQVMPDLAFTPAGMQMSGTRGPRQFMGIQSALSFVPPFTFNATVTGLAQDVIPFEIYLVSADLQQWVSIAGHLGGRGGPRSHINIGLGFGHVFGETRIPMGEGRSPEYGIWLNHTGSGWPISALGYQFFPDPLAGIPYTVQISAAADGSASVALLNAAGGVLAAQNVPVGMGPFYVVLAGRDGRTLTSWQSVQLIPAAPAPVVTAAPAVPPVPTMDYFQAQLTPYGNWVTVPGYGLCWQPSVGPGWRPYYDGGSWTYTDAGWYWQSDYPWGDIAFHYGRWAYTVAGWAWVPGYDYAPAWVVWRHADDDGYLGWAPLPPGAVFVEGGWRYHGAVVGADFDFGLGMDFFTFVPNDHFWEHDFRHWVVGRDRVSVFYRHSVIENRYRFDHGVFINVGIGRDRMAVLTHRDVREIRAVDFHDVRRHEEQHNIIVRHDDIHNFHPGERPDARGFRGPDHGPDHGFDHGPDHGAINNSHDNNNHGNDHGTPPGNQKGNSSSGGKGGGNDPRDKKN